MKIALVGPSELTNFDKIEIKTNLEALLQSGYEICILALRSIETEIFTFFINYIDEKKEEIRQLQTDLANGNLSMTTSEIESLYDSLDLSKKLSIFTFQPLEVLPERLKQPIQYLEANGANYTSFNIETPVIQRTVFIQSWRTLLEQVDVIVCFYDGETPKLLIPIDEANKMNKEEVFLYHLPRNDEKKHRLLPEEKMEKKSRNYKENLI